MRAFVFIGFVVALVSWSAGPVSASPLSVFLGPGFVPAALSVELTWYPSTQHPQPGRVGHSVRRFTSGEDGANPEAGLIDVNGVLYGTTTYGGPYNGGTLFAVTTTGQESVVYSFGSSVKDGYAPDAGLIEFNNVLYSTTSNGGQYGYGTVFAITTNGQERVLHNFNVDRGDGGFPSAGLIDVNGLFYGTAEEGGQHNGGTVFAITTSGQERAVYSFGGLPDGALPVAGLVDMKGVFYGTTSGGGSTVCRNNSGCGTVFAVTTTGHERVLHTFGSGTDGFFPLASLIDVNGVLYGTTAAGGQYGDGTVFAVTTTGQEHVLHSFVLNGVDGFDPVAGLISVKGVLYGTTSAGGKYEHGTVFAVTTTGDERVVYSFGSSMTDGNGPAAGLIDVNGVLYGTTFGGGKYGNGTVFTVTTTGKERVIYSFGG